MKIDTASKESINVPVKCDFWRWYTHLL